MKEDQSRKTTTLDHPKLERLANLLGEFLAKTWLKRNAAKVKPPATVDRNRTVNRNIMGTPIEKCRKL